jgi:hypothetical protein
MDSTKHITMVKNLALAIKALKGDEAKVEVPSRDAKYNPSQNFWAFLYFLRQNNVAFWHLIISHS